MRTRQVFADGACIIQASRRAEVTPMGAANKYRKVRLGSAGVQAACDERGCMCLRSTEALAPYPERLTERLLKWAQECPQRTLVAKRAPDGQWRSISYGEALERVRSIGQALLERGLSAERPLMILSENDLEHALLTLAAMHVGIACAPISPAYSLISQDHERLRFISGLLTPGLVFAAHGERYARAIQAAIPHDTELVVAQAPPAGRACTAFDELAATRPGGEVDAAYRAIVPDTIAKFLFTSGSTQQPKAVINTHRMLSSNQQMLLQCMPFLQDEPPVLVDWLPWNHTFGGNHNFGLVLYNGGSLYIDEGKPVPQLMHHTLANLREIAPTVYFNVPRGFEELVPALQADAGLRRNFFSRIKMLFYAAAGLSQPVWDSLHRLAEQTCGERIPMITSLGMTETAPFAICANWEAGRAGEIGLPAPGLELKLVPSEDKLELRYRGPNVTLGFWRQERLWREALDEEGYFRSGDAVRMVDAEVPQKGLMFDGRIAEDFKLATGSWVSVGPLRAKVIASGAPYVQDVVVAGADRDEIGILIFPHLDSCRKLAAGLPAQATQAEVVNDPAVHRYFSRLLGQLGADATGSANRIARAVLLGEPPLIDLGEITDKGSINQRAVLRSRAALIVDLYAPDPPEHVILGGVEMRAV
jgi:feruloyl-CoA synthase